MAVIEQFYYPQSYVALTSNPHFVAKSLCDKITGNAPVQPIR